MLMRWQERSATFSCEHPHKHIARWHDTSPLIIPKIDQSTPGASYPTLLVTKKKEVSETAHFVMIQCFALREYLGHEGVCANQAY